MLVSIGKIAEEYGVSTQTIRNWEKEGMFTTTRTRGGHRRFKVEERSEEKETVICARVCSNDQKEDLERQIKDLEKYCEESEIKNPLILKDIGSGINYKKRGLKTLIKRVVDGNVARIVINFKDRLLRFGIEMVEQICQIKRVEIVTLNSNEEKSFEYQLVEDVLAILTVYSSRIYGRRSHQRKKFTCRKFSV